MRGAHRFWWRRLKGRARTAMKRSLDPIAAGSLEGAAPAEPGLIAAPEPGAALAPRGGAWVITEALAQLEGARSRTRLAYSLYLPRAARNSQLPLVVMLHGCGQTVAEFAQGTRMNRLAGEQDFVVLYPQQSAAGHRHRCWNWYERATQDGTGDTALIAAMIETVVAEYAIDRSRIYAAGLSAGASMAHILALRRPELIAAVGLHSGVAFGAAHSLATAIVAMRHGARGSPATALHTAALDPDPFPAMPAILIHGNRDGVVSPINLVHLTEQFRMLNGSAAPIGQSASPMPLALLEGASQESAHVQQDYYSGNELRLRVCQVPALAHAWSGGDSAFPFHASEGPDASELLWQFFKSHRRVAHTGSGSGLAAQVN